MKAHHSRIGTRFGAVLGIICLGITAAACSSSPSTTSPAHSGPPSRSGTASLAYAASLLNLNERVAGPAFEKATSFKYSGDAGESGALQMEIAAGEIHPNVFQSVGGDNVAPLEPRFTKWYVQYANNAIVLAYSPTSKYASLFKAIASGKKPIKDLFTLLAAPGFRLGRTDPNLDPQGRAFIYMLELAQMTYHLPASTVTKIVGSPIASSSSPQIFSEASLDSHLESGQLDAASAYRNQAVELHLHYINLPTAINLSDFALASQYSKAKITITVGGKKTPKQGQPIVIDMTIIGTPTPAGLAFIRYTLSPAGVAQYKTAGFTPLKPMLIGSSSAVPAVLKSAVGG